MKEMMDEMVVGVTEYHTNKVLEVISDYRSLMEALVACAISSNVALV